MGKHAQIVMGPAGSGKSTFCYLMQRHCEASSRRVHVVNLDPAAEEFKYEVSIDVRDLISVDDVMEELGLGPNGSLVYCMEYLVQNLDWLQDAVDNFDDDYLIIDLPGQIELFTHVPMMRTIVDALQRWGYQVCGVYLLDAVFISDASRFISGAMSCLAAMIRLELPHVNVLSKCDTITDKTVIDKYLDADADVLVDELNQENARFSDLNAAVGELLRQYGIVSFLPLDATDEDSIGYVLSSIDAAIQYGEDLEPLEKDHTHAADENTADDR